ncbi:MAG: hypothetical protein M3380_06620 [Chloroflexota bacterium]|nr:hypothetical protein [Chloroflexota bacterium]
MPVDENAGFTTERILQQAQGNVAAILLGTAAYLQQQGLSPHEWATALGRTFAPGWEELRGRGARDVAQIAVLNHLSAGAKLISLEGDDHAAEAVVDWPTQEMLDFIGFTHPDADVAHDILRPIAEYLNLQYEWRREGDHVRVRFTQDTSASTTSQS